MLRVFVGSCALVGWFVCWFGFLIPLWLESSLFEHYVVGLGALIVAVFGVIYLIHYLIEAMDSCLDHYLNHRRRGKDD